MSNKNRSQRDAIYESKRAGKRTRNWTVIFYPEDLPENWANLVDDLHFKWIEGPLHDKDVNADGQPKKPHRHTLFLFDAIKTEEQVTSMLKEVFGESETGSITGVAPPQQVTDRCSIVRYMAHLDNPDKVQYETVDIIGHNGADPAEILRYSVTETRQMVVAMEEYIEQNEITELVDFSLAIRYEQPEWHTLLTTKMTMYFNAFIRSNRHKNEKSSTKFTVDQATGEVISG
jgi:hypothetical protein